MSKKNAKWFSIVSGLLVLALCISLLPGALQNKSAYAAGEAQQDKQIIQVSGTGEISVDPDVAYVTLGIETRADSAAKAQADNAQTFAALEKVLYGDFKLDKKDVKTVNFQIQPQMAYSDKEGPRITGYSADHSVVITYRDLPNLGKLLDAASAAGVNNISGIRFGTEKMDQYELQALQKAMANAESKAGVIAKTSNRTLKGILNVTENGSSSAAPGPIMYEAKAMDSAASTSIAPGQLKITKDVTVQYEF